jgi:F-type H+-transporting ATPase subunit epsilon
MHLKILLPYKVFVDDDQVQRIVALTTEGAFGILPHRLDFAAALSPGLLAWRGESGADTYAAVDVGVMVKAGDDVLCSVRNAVSGADLGALREAVERQFLNLSSQEQSVRNALLKLETGLTRRLAEFNHE